MKHFVLSFAFMVNSWAIQPVDIPKDIQDEVADAVLIHKGKCETSTDNADCLVFFQEKGEVFWLLLYEEGVLYKVMTVQNKVETVRWLHPMRGV